MRTEPQTASENGAEKDESPKMSIWLIIIFVGAVLIGLTCFIIATLSLID